MVAILQKQYNYRCAKCKILPGLLESRQIFSLANFFYHARKLLGDFETSGLESCLKNFVEFLRNFNYYEKRHFEFL